MIGFATGSESANKAVYRKFAFFIVVILLIGGLIGIYIMLNIAGTNDRINLSKLEEIKRELEKEQKELRVSIEFVGSPQRIESMAQGRYGMVPMTGDHVYVVKVKPSAPDKRGH